MKRRGMMALQTLLALALSAATGVSAQSLDEVERQIEAAKREEAAKAAEARRAAEARAAGERQRAATAASRGTLVIRASGDCELVVNGSAQGSLSAGVTRSVQVPAGGQLIECRGQSGAMAEAQATIEAGAQAVVVLEMPRFSVIGGGVVVDSETSLQWTQSDNGHDIDWPGANSYCQQRAGGWRLPSSNELGALVGKYDNGDEAMKPFRLTGCCAWTNERNGSSEVFLGYGNRYAYPLSSRRALCVRRP